MPVDLVKAIRPFIPETRLRQQAGALWLQAEKLGKNQTESQLCELQFFAGLQPSV
jgi:hypothetical protein